jgi:nucleoporin SEH1
MRRTTKSQGIDEVEERTSHRDKLVAYSSVSFPNGDPLPTLSSDKVLDMCLDHYGQRLAVSSSDGRICVWDLDCSTGQWVGSAHTESEWQTGTIIHQLRWAHPNFGQILASAGSDNILILWEECEEDEEDEEDNETQQGRTDLLLASTTKRYRWVPKARLNDARAFVTCIGFAPPHLGLKVAAGSADGMVRIYEAIDLMNLHYWPLHACIDVDATTTSTTGSRNSSSSIVTTEQPVGVTCLAWSTRRLQELPTLAVGTSNGTIALYRYYDTARQWLLLLQFPGHTGGGGVIDIAWAPNMGRNFHWIASIGQDRRTLQMHRLSTSSSSQPYELVSSSQILQEEDTTNALWRCAWNVTGTVLSSTSLGGMIRMWKVDFWNHWKCVAQIHPNEVSSNDTTKMEEETIKHTSTTTTTIPDQVMELD